MEERNKQVKTSTKAWHYKLLMFVFGKTIGDLRDMRNLCPYFWLTIAAMIIVIPSLPFKLVIGIIRAINKKIQAFKKSKLVKWLKTVSAAEAGDMYHGNFVLIEKPKSAKGVDSWDLIAEWAAIHGLDPKAPDYHVKLKALMDEVKAEREKLKEQRIKDSDKLYRLRCEKQKRREARDKKIKETLDSFAKFFSIKRDKSLTDKQRGVKNRNAIIKNTKRFVGLLITISIAVCIVILGQFASYGILSLIKIWSWSGIWQGTLYALVILAILSAIIGISVFLAYIVNYAQKTYKEKGSFVWYAIPFVYLVFAIFYTLKYVIYYPVGYFLCYIVIWKLICVSLSWGIIKGFGKGFANFGGIFAEYFGSAYSDFCPELGWEEDEIKETPKVNTSIRV